MKYEYFEGYKPVTVYAIKFEGKIIYIGITTRGVKARSVQHFRNALRGKGRLANASPKLYNFIRSNKNLSSYSVTVLEQCSINEGEHREKYYVSLYDTYFNGCNTTVGGNWSRGKEHYAYGDSNATRKAVEASVKARLGKPLSEKTKQKMREARAKNKLNARMVRCVDTGETFPSVTKASESIGVNRAALIKALKKKYKSGGYSWEYLE